MPELVTICRICGQDWTPDHQDYVRNTWRVCPQCRDGPASNHTNDPPEPRSGAGNDAQATRNHDDRSSCHA